jgi:hypothetical protein
MKSRYVVLVTACMLAALSSCKKSSDVVSSNDDGTSVAVDLVKTGTSVRTALAANTTDHEVAADYTWDSALEIPITLNGTAISENTDSASISGSILTISSGGTYRLKGTLTNGQIHVNASDKGTVRIVLDGINITNSSTSPLYVEKAAKTVIVLADNSQNYVTDAASYVFPSADEDEPNAAIFSKDNLTIAGNGSLTVKGNYNDAIASKDGLVIKSGSITVTSVDDGIRGKDYLAVKGGTIKVTAAGDGLKSDNDEDATKGYIYVENGTVNITAGGDGFAAETDALIGDGTFSITSGGGSNATVSGDASAKGIKGVASVIIGGGTFTISSADDAIHSNSLVVVNSGTFTMASGDDGIHADSLLGINGGTITINKCYEGIESIALVINDGTIHVTSSDDGINGAGGNDGSAAGGWGGTAPTAGNRYLAVNGGYIAVNAAGDGIDVNGSIVMTGGTVLVHGPTSNGNGPLDYDATFSVSGGTIVAAGSSGMAMAPSKSSTQNSILVTFTSTKSAGTLFHIQASDGSDVLTFKSAKSYQSVAFCSPKLATGSTYDVYVGGNSSGTVTDGVYEGGTYSSGTKSVSFTVSGSVTTVRGS